MGMTLPAQGCHSLPKQEPLCPTGNFQAEKEESGRALPLKRVGRPGFGGTTWVREVGQEEVGQEEEVPLGPGWQWNLLRTLNVHRPARDGFRGTNKAPSWQGGEGWGL